MDDHLLLQKSNRTYILLPYPDRYHIITVNKHLDDKTEETLCSGCFSDHAIDEMGLTRDTIRKSDLRGVSIGGYFAGDTIIFHTKSKKLKYTLADHYDLFFMDSLFSAFTDLRPQKPAAQQNSKKIGVPLYRPKTCWLQRRSSV